MVTSTVRRGAGDERNLYLPARSTSSTVFHCSYGTGGLLRSNSPSNGSCVPAVAMAALTSDTIHGHTLRSSRRKIMLLASAPTSADDLTSSNSFLYFSASCLAVMTGPGTFGRTSPPTRKNIAAEPTHIRTAAAMNHLFFRPQTCSRRLPTGDRLMEISVNPRPCSASPTAVERFMALAAKSLAALPSTLIFSNSSRRRISTPSWSLRNLRSPGIRNVLPRPMTCETGLSGCSDW